VTRAQIQQKIQETKSRSSVEEWLLDELGEEQGAIVCDDLDSFDWSEVE
jgi:hypothetical protein